MHNAWAGFQLVASPRVQLYANTQFTRADASIADFSYGVSEYAAELVGLDYPLMASAFSGFSDLSYRLFVQDAGLNIRVSSRVFVNGTLRYNRYDDEAPYLFDATGRYLTVYGAVRVAF